MPWFQTPTRFAEATDWRACEDAIRHGSSSFYSASRILPSWLRRDACALYAFCRLSDDAVDVEGGDSTSVTQLRARLDRVYDGAPADDAIERALSDVVRTHGIPKALPNALLDGMEWDVNGVACETPSDLYAYSARVAASVGAMMALLMGARSPAQLARACDLGVAMQLTNIARDVGEDARIGRLYLPRQWMREEGIDPDAWLHDPKFNDALGRVVQRVLVAADVLYSRADAGISALPLSCRPGIYGARHIYRGIGAVVAQNGYDSVSTRAYTDMSTKVKLMARALLDSRPFAKAIDHSPPLQETAFLVNAVHADPDQDFSVAPHRTDRFTDRLVWVAALFADLEQRQQTHNQRL